MGAQLVIGFEIGVEHIGEQVLLLSDCFSLHSVGDALESDFIDSEPVAEVAVFRAA